MDGTVHQIPGKWDLLIAHPPCTYFSNSGNVHLYMGTEIKQRGKDIFRLINEGRVKKAIMARDFFMSFFNADCKSICIENPIPSTIWCLPKKSQSVQPFEYGDPFSKKTYLWLKGLPLLTPTEVVVPIARWVDGGHKGRDDSKIFGFRDPKRRAKTFPGIARAMAAQWGGDIRSDKHD